MAGGDKTTSAEQELIARLDQAFAHQRDLDPAVLASVRAWQRADRSYELVQRLARGWDVVDLSHAEAYWVRKTRAHLDMAIASGQMPCDAVVYRGIRNLGRSLAVDVPSGAVGHVFPQRGYLATTAIAKVAIEEFLASSGALVELLVPMGTPALWVAGVGHPLLRRQGELLLPDKVDLHVYSLSWVDSIPTLSAKVVTS